MTLTPTAELNDLLNLAALINSETSERFNYTFRALLLALLFGRDDLSQWCKDHLRNSGVDVAALLNYGKLEGKEDVLLLLATQAVDPQKLYPDGHRSGSASSLAWLGKAKTLSEEQKHASGLCETVSRPYRE